MANVSVRGIISGCAVVLGVVSVPLITAGPAQAHCPDPGNNGHRYVAGGNSSNTVRSVRTRLGWMASSNVCNSGASYSISITRGLGGSDPGWLQVGWRYFNGYSRPMGYCERMPRNAGSGSYAMSEYPVAQQLQLYAYVKNDDRQFECRIDGETLRVTHEDWIGFDNGVWVPVQAEAHARHVQLGRIAPSWLYFADTAKVVMGGSTWSQMNVTDVDRSDTVWNYTQPNADGFGVNTDANH